MNKNATEQKRKAQNECRPVPTEIRKSKKQAKRREPIRMRLFSKILQSSHPHAEERRTKKKGEPETMT